MNQRTFSFAAGAFFLLIALGHILRIAFGLTVIVDGRDIPMWVSWVATIVTGYLSWEGFRLGKKSQSGP